MRRCAHHTAIITSGQQVNIYDQLLWEEIKIILITGSYEKSTGLSNGFVAV